MRTAFVACSIFLTISFKLTAQDPPAILKNALNDLQLAMEKSDGVKASKYVDRRTKDYYGKILYLVKSADSTRLFALPLVDILAAAYVRHVYPLETILAMDTLALMHAELSNGLIQKLDFRDMNIEGAVMPSDSPNASARISQTYLEKRSRGKAFYMNFTREDNIWKVNLPSVMAFADVVLKEKPELKALGEPLYVKYVLEKLTQKPVSKNVWKPISKK